MAKAVRLYAAWVLSALLLIFAKVAVADAGAGAGVGGFNPEGQYCPGAVIEVREVAGASAEVDVWGTAGYATTDRDAHFNDELLGAGDIVGGGNGTVAETCHGYLLLEGNERVGGSPVLTQEHVGEYDGARWASALAVADDGINHVEVPAEEYIPYHYTVALCWVFPPDEGVEPPDVLEPGEISD